MVNKLNLMSSLSVYFCIKKSFTQLSLSNV
nr:MAG TPA: hypothetical protein [Caudoviricetes sp.]